MPRRSRIELSGFHHIINRGVNQSDIYLQENLSLMMRQVNSYYAIYFNKKENRVGHLWQGRFRSLGLNSGVFSH
jgi:putative transposase